MADDHRLEISGSRDSLAFPVITVFIKQAHTAKLKSYICCSDFTRIGVSAIYALKKIVKVLSTHFKPGFPKMYVRSS